MLPEEWRAVPSFAGVCASSLGRVRVLPYSVAMPHGGYRTREVVPTFGQWDGDRFHVVIRRKTYNVARLVCEAFHGIAPTDSPNCLHGDENARNNVPTNLTWGTQKENLNAPGFLNYCRSRTGENNPYIKGRKARATDGR